MYSKIVSAHLKINGEVVTIKISVSCNPNMPDDELERRAGNILRSGALNATYSMEWDIER